MTQTFEKFTGLPDDLLARLEVIKTVESGVIDQVITTSVAAVYIIIWSA